MILTSSKNFSLLLFFLAPIECTPSLPPAAVALANDDFEDEVEEVQSGPYNPLPIGDYVFFENFQGEGVVGDSFVKSKNDKYKLQEWKHEPTSDYGIEGDKALIVGAKARHYGVYSKFPKPVINTDKNLVLQYEVALSKGLECGGAYLKFLDNEVISKPNVELTNETPYIIMFGPDKCGGTNKVHLIIRHKNPVSGDWEEKHLKMPPSVPSDENTHLYSLTIRNDNTFDVRIDQEVKREGSLMEEFDPPFNPPKEIDDPNDHKPADWVDNAKMADASAVKPDDWDEDAPVEIADTDAKMPSGWLEDEPEYVADPESKMPEDWDEDEDGSWEAPLVKNPKCEAAPGCGEWVTPMKRNPNYKGKWSAPLIDNPAYIGEWKPKKIENPNYFMDETPCNLPAIGGVAIEIWTMNDGIAFDNIFIGYDANVASDLADRTWKEKNRLEGLHAESKKAADEAKRRESLKSDGSVTAMIEYYTIEAVDFLKANPWVGIIPVFLLVVLAWQCTKPGKVSAAHKDDDDAEDEVEGEGEEEEEDEGDKSKKSPATSATTSPKSGEAAKGDIRNRKAKKAE
jgi:calnexin